MLNNGDGNVVVSLALDILPSFLPLGTSQVGPPDCKSCSVIRSERLNSNAEEVLIATI